MTEFTPMQARLLATIQEAGLEFPWLDEQAILDRIAPTAEEWILMQIVTNHLDKDDQELFRDSYASAPDVFDPVEFLSDTIPEFDELIETYFEEWISDFKKNLQ